MNKVEVVFNLFFGCRHRQLSRVFTLDRRTYRVCCNCGMKFEYSLESMSIRNPWFESLADRKSRAINPNVVGAR
jgi:hypothetical protein